MAGDHRKTSPELRAESLNEAQRRRLLSSARYADQLLTEIESILNSAGSKCLFPKYRPDVTPAQAKLIRNSIARFREQLSRALDSLGVVHEGPPFEALRSIRITLGFVQVAVEEMAPQYLRGYGSLPQGAVSQLQGVCAELEGLLKRLDASLAQEATANLQPRLRNLEKAGSRTGLLPLLEEIIQERGLIELRPRLAQIVERLESKQFEIAVFGRVSSGKSSLLNYILQTEVLPVGVNPITAVPTRLIHGDEPALIVDFADRRRERLPIERLPEFVSELENPSNVKEVVRLVVEFPSPRLINGLVFVDTPGLGALAATGAAETLAYLPQCDLGVVLISAASPLNDEDLSTIGLLYESAVPVKVLISKADLLKPSELGSALDYTRSQIRAQLGVDTDVHPVSTADSHAQLLDRWLQNEILPLYEKSRQLAAESIRRKTGALKEAVVANLKAKLERAGAAPAPQREELIGLEADLRHAAGRIEQARRECTKLCDGIRSQETRIWEQVALLLLAGNAGGEAPGGQTLDSAIRNAVDAGSKIHELLLELAHTLAHSLQRAAAALGATDALETEELTELVREMPRFDPPALDIRLPSLRWLPSALARAWLMRRLRSKLGPAFREALATYGRLLEHWSRKTLAELQSQFDAAAEPYRAQLAGRISRGALPAELRDAIDADLARLEAAGLSEAGTAAGPAGANPVGLDKQV